MNSRTEQPRELGRSINRVDGRLKVTGAARYAADFPVKGLLHAVAVKSAVSNGRITAMDVSAAESSSGVRVVITHRNALKLKKPKPLPGTGIQNEQRMPLSDDVISYGGQYVALVVATSIEEARHAASLIRIGYEQAPPALTVEQARHTAKKPKSNNMDAVQLKKGDVEGAMEERNLTIVERVYETPAEMHNPMEPSATIAEWVSDEEVVLHDATQFVKGVQNLVAQAFDLKTDRVRVISPFVGGAFGCKGAVWPHVFLAVMAAKMAGAPVKFALSRPDMFSGTGHRTPTRQTIALAASTDGTLRAIRHRAETLTSPLGEFVESCGARTAGVLYASPNIEVEETLYTVNVATPTFMRAPGECPGTFAMECAMDELATELKMDPVALRLKNHSDVHPISEKPWSTKFLKDAYRVGAEKFGWEKRTAAPRSMMRDGKLVGWGIATATYPAHSMLAKASITLEADGGAVIKCAAHDLGTGAYTVLTQIGAEAIGVPVGKVKFELGDSTLPFGPVAGGSNTTATVGSAIYQAAAELHKKLGKLATSDRRSPLYGRNSKDIAANGDGRLSHRQRPELSDSFEDILRRANQESMEATGGFELLKLLKKKHAFQSFGAHFCEVQIDPDLPNVKVTRVVSVVDCGRVMNPKTARSQILGGVVMGIGMALEEEALFDSETGLCVTRNLADYHVPVNADIRDLGVHFVGEPDFTFNPMGARGMGEIGITGIAAAIANAVHHATGIRVRELPIHIEKLFA